MTRSSRSVRLALVFVPVFLSARGAASPPGAEPVTASSETTLTTNDAQIRQFAFDGDGAAFFASKEPPGADDHFTLVLDKPVRLTTVAATTVRADGSGKIEAGTLEVSADGTTFRELTRFAGGTAQGGPADWPSVGKERSVRTAVGSSRSGPAIYRDSTSLPASHARPGSDGASPSRIRAGLFESRN